MALNPGALLDVADIFEYMRESVPTSDNPEYSLVEELINRASAEVRQILGGPVINENITEDIDGNGDDYLFLTHFPVVSISSVTMDGVDVTANTDFYKHGELFFKDGSCFSEGRKNIRVSYVAGRGQTKDEIPQDIRHAALLIVHYWYKRDALDYSQSFGETEVITTGGPRYPRSALYILNRYQRGGVMLI